MKLPKGDPSGNGFRQGTKHNLVGQLNPHIAHSGHLVS